MRNVLQALLLSLPLLMLRSTSVAVNVFVVGVVVATAAAIVVGFVLTAAAASPHNHWDKRRCATLHSTLIKFELEI